MPYWKFPFDLELLSDSRYFSFSLSELKADHELVITLEDGVLDGGFGEKIARYYGATNMKVLNFGAKKEFVDRYDIQEFLRANHLTDEQIVEDITAVIG